MPDLFTWPFIIGATYLIIIVLFRFIRWFIGLSKIDKIRIWKNFRTNCTWISIKESFMEGLLHRRIFKKNRLLGYMHMSLAFGWFLLILIGHIETVFYAKSLHFPLYLPIFFRYYVTGHDYFLSGFLGALMDFLLLFVLSGVLLAYLKRFSSKFYGLKKVTRLKSGDRIALSFLWFIFPLRLIAEGISAGLHNNGSFLTQPLGNLLKDFLPLENLINPAWYAYSLSLGLFFIALPNSRYMHIPAEIFVIFIRNYGVRLKKRHNTYSDAQVFACSRCGICLDVCQMNNAGIRNSQSVYVLKNIRNNVLTDEVLFNCLLCGKCQQVCPVGIETNDLRITQRIETTLQYNSQYNYLRDSLPEKAKVIYFAGCMTHLTPGIYKSMENIFNYAGINYWFMDREKAPCCGRPLMQAGQYDAAKKLIQNNTAKIIASGATKLVVSCPICYKVFKEDYSLPDIQVLHHSQYLLDLADQGLIPQKFANSRAIYHDPCELGRGSGIYNEPRELMKKYVEIVSIKHEKEDSLCCGGSLANIKIQMSERDLINKSVLSEYAESNPDLLITSCPMCKKTFSRSNVLPVRDIAEIVSESITASKSSQELVETDGKTAAGVS